MSAIRIYAEALHWCTQRGRLAPRAAYEAALAECEEVET